MNHGERSLIIHEQLRGKIGVNTKLKVESQDDLSIAYTPGVAAPCEAIAAHPEKVWDLTIKRNSVAIVSDGSAVLGLGNIGPEAAIPVMEGKALLFKQYADIDAWPICLATQDSTEIIETVRRIAPVFGGVNLEDISAPRCFEIEDALQDLGIPVFHDDQHGTAIVLLAGLLNAAKVVGKETTDLTVVINGAGAAGTAIAKLLRCVGHDPAVCAPVKEIIVCDSKGAIHSGRTDLNPEKLALLEFTNQGQHAIILAMANPLPEIMPDEAKAGGAAVVGTGRSDFPNQVNNVLAFPGIFRGALEAKAKQISPEMKIAAAHALAASVSEPTADRILPSPLDSTVAPIVAAAVAEAAK